MICKWCGAELTGWYLTYKGCTFCRKRNDMCLKNLLFEEHDKDIGMDKVVEDYYDMGEVEYD